MLVLLFRGVLAFAAKRAHWASLGSARVLPISGKPNVILFGTNHYTVRENLRHGLVICTFGYALLLLAGATWFHWLGITPAFGALP